DSRSCLRTCCHAFASHHPHSSLVFFFMLRRPPRSTLFPTRRSSDLPFALSSAALAWQEREFHALDLVGILLCMVFARSAAMAFRSEEHTSELQSHLNLVCRLLLEKKKSRKAINYPYAYNSFGTMLAH